MVDGAHTRTRLLSYGISPSTFILTYRLFSPDFSKEAQLYFLSHVVWFSLISVGLTQLKPLFVTEGDDSGHRAQRDHRSGPGAPVLPTRPPAGLAAILCRLSCCQWQVSQSKGAYQIGRCV